MYTYSVTQRVHHRLYLALSCTSKLVYTIRRATKHGDTMRRNVRRNTSSEDWWLWENGNNLPETHQKPQSVAEDPTAVSFKHDSSYNPVQHERPLAGSSVTNGGTTPTQFCTFAGGGKSNRQDIRFRELSSTGSDSSFTRIGLAAR